MKTTALSRSLPLLLLLFLSWLNVSALDCGVNYAVYKTGDKPYVEISLEIAGASVTFKQADTSHLQASVDILLLLKSGDMVVNYEKYVLNSPLVDRAQSLLDVKRMSAPNGEYTLEVTFQDLNDPLNRKVFSIPVSVKMDDALYLSELELLRNFKKDAGEGPFNKNGYFMEPLPFSFYDRSANRLAFYAEIYNIDKLVPADKTYLIRYFVEQDKGGGQMTLASMGNQRKKPPPLMPFWCKWISVPWKVATIR